MIVLSEIYLIPIITSLRVRDSSEVVKVVSILEGVDEKDVLVVDNVIYVRSNGRFVAKYVIVENLKHEINKS